MTPEEHAEHVQQVIDRLVDEAPPLTEAQQAELRDLLAPPRKRPRPSAPVANRAAG